MREKCVPVFAGNDVLDIVGTGGDGIGSVNISTGKTPEGKNAEQKIIYDAPLPRL